VSGEDLSIFNNYIVINSAQPLCYDSVRSGFPFTTSKTMMLTTAPFVFGDCKFCH